uniref:uncharacterized protein LOC114679686 n=1 Tax=Macaca mulatta TaxID=9544 RepID=UPI0010A2095A|nr:uncharacterized protein LOC114679686 [Macaca mulatta]
MPLLPMPSNLPSPLQPRDPLEKLLFPPKPGSYNPKEKAREGMRKLGPTSQDKANPLSSPSATLTLTSDPRPLGGPWSLFQGCSEALSRLRPTWFLHRDHLVRGMWVYHCPWPSLSFIMGGAGPQAGRPRPCRGSERALTPRASGRRSHDGRKGGSRRRPRPPQPRSEPPRLDRRAAVPLPAAGGRAAGGGRRSAAPARQDRGTVRRRHWPAPPAPATAHWPPRCTIVTMLSLPFQYYLTRETIHSAPSRQGLCLTPSFSHPPVLDASEYDGRESKMSGGPGVNN